MSDEYMTMIDDCIDREHKLTDWERNFIDSVKAQIESGRGLTRKQEDMIDVIWQKVT